MIHTKPLKDSTVHKSVGVYYGRVRLGVATQPFSDNPACMWETNNGKAGLGDTLEIGIQSVVCKSDMTRR